MTQQERFEAWATSQGINITDNGFGGYDSQWTEGALAGWEAAQAQAAVKPVAYLTETEQGPMVWTPDMYGEACTYCDDGEFPVPLYTSPPDSPKAMRLALEALKFIKQWGECALAVEKRDAAIAALEKELK
jgi:hypothetical protein